MSCSIKKLNNISNSSSRSIIGLMSGTSLDGLDIAHCVIQSHGPDTQIDLINFTTVDYSNEVKNELRKLVSVKVIELGHLCDVHAWLAKLHGEMILKCLSDWGVNHDSIDVIASHGQTIFHNPKSDPSSKFPHSTLQIGDGDHLAVMTGIITISDFRQKHIAGGGEGAPLALYGDYFIFSKKGENRIMLNIGGIANITCLFGDLDSTKAFATDLGPGNTLIDAWVRKHFSRDFDKDSTIGFSGRLNEDLLRELKKHPFFLRPFPKTTGPEMFNLEYVEAAANKINPSINYADVVTTLTKLTADIIITSLKSLKDYDTFKIYASGGGAHNPMLMLELTNGLPGTYISTTDELGIPGDAKEAVLFAALANETLCGKPNTYKFGSSSKGSRMPSLTMGKISFPN